MAQGVLETGHGEHAAEEPFVYGILAEFEHPQELVPAAQKAYQAGYRRMDAYSPLPVEGSNGKISTDLTSISISGTASSQAGIAQVVLKNVTTGEGGMLTGDPALVDEARTWILHGMSRDAWRRYDSDGSWQYDVVQAGFKYNLTDPAAALGLVQLRRLPEFQARRRRIVGRYQEAFASLPEIETPRVHPNAEHAWHHQI